MFDEFNKIDFYFTWFLSSFCKREESKIFKSKIKHIKQNNPVKMFGWILADQT